MAKLYFPDENRLVEGFEPIRDWLGAKGVWHDRWEASVPFAPDADQATVLAAYEHALRPLMERGGYQTADVLVVHAETPNLDALRAKFLKEHTHTEDEVRFFVEGKGYFWFHLPNEPVFCVECGAGDLLSVPAGIAHWFELDDPAHVKAIRVFIDMSGWVPQYTESGVDARYASLPQPSVR